MSVQEMMIEGLVFTITFAYILFSSYIFISKETQIYNTKLTQYKEFWLYSTIDK